MCILLEMAASARLLGTLILLCFGAAARGVLCLAGQGSSGTNQYLTVLGVPLPRHAALSGSAAAAADDDGPRIQAAFTKRHLTEASSGSTEHGHKPLFPVSGFEIAILCIAGVVLFIAAGEPYSRMQVRLQLLLSKTHAAATAWILDRPPSSLYVSMHIEQWPASAEQAGTAASAVSAADANCPFICSKCQLLSCSAADAD